MMEFWNKKIETLSRNEIEKLQLERINIQLNQAKKSNWYKDKLPDHIKSLAEIKGLVFTSKAELRKGFPYEFLAIPHNDILRLNASSGTTGIPTFMAFSKRDLDTVSDNEARNLFMAGLRPNMILQEMMGFGLFVAGWVVYHATQKIGATILPTGPGNTIRQIELLDKLGASFTYSTPSYLQHILSQIPPEILLRMKLKKAVTAGEPLSEQFQNQSLKTYGIEIFNSHGLTEFGGPIAGECIFHKGLHLLEDRFYVEIIDPDTGKSLPDGEYGELVVTPLQQEAMPLVRYRTRDITRIIPGECPCGRTHRRIEPVTHRIDDMMIINGVNVFPSQIEECIYKHISTATNYLIHITEKEGLKKLLIDIEIPNELLNNEIGLKKLESQLTQTLKSYITVTPKLNFIPMGTLPEIQGKAKRVVRD